MITARTRLVALLGHPVDHSLSPRMQNAAFAARGLDWGYVALDVPPERFGEAVRGLAAAGFAGANVTTPHKLATVESSDVVDDAVLESGSANTLVFRHGNIAAWSTDAHVLATVDASGPAVVLGSGGAATAFAYALSRDRRDVRTFARRGAWPPDVRGAKLIVNATSERDEVLVELERGQTLVDLPYPLSATGRAARDAGARVIDGFDVLVAQGAASFELWTGVPAPVDVMRAAVRPTLAP